MPSPPAPAAPPAQGGKKWIVAAGALALAGGAFVAVRSRSTSAEHAEAKPKAAVIEPSIIDVDPFVLNLADPAGDRYLRLNLRLVIDQKEIAKRAESDAAQVKLRDRLLALLAKTRAGELATVEGKEALRHEIASAAEPLFAQPPLHVEGDPAPARVTDVLFTEFLVQ